MKSLTKGIFSSLLTLVFLFSPVESTNSSTFNNSLFETLGDVQDNLVIESKIASSDNTGGEIKETSPEPNGEIKETSPEVNAKPISPEEIKSWADASWSIFLNVLFWSLFLGLLFLLWGLATKGKGTIVLPFKDLTEKNNALQRINQEQSQNKNQEKLKEKSKIEEIIPEMLVAKLYKIRHIYELAGQFDKQFIQGLHVSDPDICIDTKILSLNKDNLNDLLASGSFPIIKFSSGDLAKNIGEVTEIGLVAGKISLDNMIAFLQQILPNIFTGLGSRKKRTITGSIQGCENNLRLIAHMESGRHFWACEVYKRDTNNSNDLDKTENNPDQPENNLGKQRLLSQLVEELAYKIADQLSGYPIGYDSFKTFTELLEDYIKYKKNPNQKPLEDLTKECIEFFETEPTDIRSFGLLYNLGITALTNEQNKQVQEQNKNQKAEELFRNAISLEPYIVQRICELQIPLNKLKWSKEKIREVQNTYKRLRLELNKDLNPLNQLLSRSKSLWLRLFWNLLFLSTEGRVLVRWSESISYALNALGQTLEIKCQPALCGKDLNTDEKENSDTANKSKDGDKNEICYVNLCESMEAYERASHLATDDAQFLSNLASLKIEQVNLLAEKVYLKESKLREAEKNLQDATSKKITKNKHLAYNRLGNLYHEQGNYTKAISNYNDALKAKPDFVVVYRNLGIIYLDKRDFDQAIENFEKGMKILSDDKLFHGNLYFEQLHAWLHNGIGWTYLMKVIDDSIHKTEICPRERSSDLSDLNKAKHHLQEAIYIFQDCISKCTNEGKEDGQEDCKSDIPLYVPCLNLGHVYAWQGKVQKAFDNWKKGLELCKHNEKQNEIIKMFSDVYKFAEEEEGSKSPENSEPNKSHWRLRLRALYEARVVKQTIKHLQENKAKSCNQKINNLENFGNSLIENIEELENDLPTFYLGLAYLWKNDYESTKSRWEEKINKLDDPSKKQNEDKIEDKILDFNNYLWLYIYRGLVAILKNQNKPWASQNKAVKGEFIPQVIMYKILLHMYPPHIRLYSQIDTYSKGIEQCTQNIRKYIKDQDNHTIQLIYEVLDDINYKFEILKQGPKPFHKNCVESYYVNKLFDPVVSCRKTLKKCLKSKVSVSGLATFKKTKIIT